MISQLILRARLDKLRRYGKETFWAAISRLSAALYRQRLLGALCIFTFVWLLPCLMLTQSATLLLIDGQPIGTVADANTVFAAVRSLEREASDFTESPYTMPLSFAFQSTRSTPSALLSDGALRERLLAQDKSLTSGAVITVDGMQVGVCDTLGQAQQLLDEIRAEYTSPQMLAAAFVQPVAVRTAAVPLDAVDTEDGMRVRLHDRLQVRQIAEVTYTETIPYDTLTYENDAVEQNKTQTLQCGQSGKALVTAEVVTLNGEIEHRTVTSRVVLAGATNEIIEVGTKNIGYGTGELHCPLNDYVLSSTFRWRNGRMHNGVDLAVPEGSAVYAADNGVVLFAGNPGDGYGNYIILDHRNGMKTLYAHNAELLVSPGDIVAQGQQIARSGNTGNSTGPHLHFEVMVNDTKVNPVQYLSF